MMKTAEDILNEKRRDAVWIAGDRTVMDAVKIKELNAVASWEYYEDWGWDRKKRK